MCPPVCCTENWGGESPLPGCEDIAASFQEAVCRHLLTRTHRALLYTQQFFPGVRHLVGNFFLFLVGLVLLCDLLQWNPFNQDTNGTEESVHNY